MLILWTSTTIERTDFWLLTFSNFVTSRPRMYEKREKRPLERFWDRLRKLFVRHSFPNSETLGLSRHVIIVKVEQQMLFQ